MGFEKYRIAIKEGTQDPSIHRLISYARYLSNGGTPQGWDTLNDIDILLMDTYYQEQRYKEMEAQAILIANYIGKLFGGKD